MGRPGKNSCGSMRQGQTGARWPAFLMMTLVFACSKDVELKDSAPPPDSVNIDSIPDAVPRDEPRSKYGNPDSYEVFGKRYYVMKDNRDFVERGIASWYGKKFHGRRTSNGETYDMYAMTAAHKKLPLPSFVEVTNLKNNRRVIVRVNDRGPFHENRIIDLSYSAARKLDIVAHGTGLVEVRVIDSRGYAGGKPGRDRGTPVERAPVRAPVNVFYIQVGAFVQETNARRLQQQISPLGDRLVIIRQAEVDGQTIYRVQIGPLDDIDMADNIVARLGDFGITEHRIVIDR